MAAPAELSVSPYTITIYAILIPLGYPPADSVVYLWGRDSVPMRGVRYP